LPRSPQADRAGFRPRQAVITCRGGSRLWAGIQVRSWKPTEDPTMPRAKQRTEQLREHIVQVAVAKLAADGVGGLTTRKVAEQAQTSPPAVYELFGDKAGLVREVFFEGFRLLGDRFGRLRESDDPHADLFRAVQAFRIFVRDNPVLAQVMFSRPFADFDPGPAELEAGTATREFVVHRVRRCIEAGIIDGDQTDIAHALLALSQGLAMQETAGWLGSSRASVDRRWDLAVRALLAGLGRPSPG
jgi:AcrR family transcriptional regulator